MSVISRPRIVQTSTEYTIRDQERMKLAARYFEWQCRMALPELGKRVLEIGCGMGNFTQHMLERERVIGIDVEEACILQHHRRFRGAEHISSFVTDILDPSFTGAMREHNIDSAVCLNVLEHVSDDLLALQHLYSVLPKGGRGVFIVPAFEALYGPIDALLGHYRRYTKKSFAAVAKQAGFRVLKLRYFNSVGFFGWYVNSHVFKKVEQSEGQVRFFDSKIVPILSTVEKYVPPPFGQSVFAVIEKSSQE